MLLCFWVQTVSAQVESPFFQPISDQNLAAIEYLVRQGLDVNQPNDFGLTPLEFAIRAKAVASAQLLHRYGASFELIDPTVITEFQRQPGIGPFLSRYAIRDNTNTDNTNTDNANRNNATNISSTTLNQTSQVPAQIPTPVPTKLSQPTTIQVNQTQASNVQQVPVSEQQISSQQVQASTRQPVPSRENSNSANPYINNDSSLVEVIRPQTSIGIASTMTVAPRTSASSANSIQSTISQSNETISAFRQPSEIDTSTQPSTTIPETVSSLPAPQQEPSPSIQPEPQAAPQTQPSKTPQQVHFDNPTKVCKIKNPNLVVSFTFDDGETTDLPVINEVFAPRQVTGTLGIILNRLGTNDRRYMQVNELRELYNMGWEIASHTIDHDDLTSLETEDLDYDLLESHKGLQALGFDVSSLVYPYGANNNRVRSHTSKYYYGAFEGGYRLNTRNSNPFNLKRFHIADAHDFPYYKRVTDSYSDQHGWLVWAVHTSLNFDEQQVEDLHQLLDYMCDQGIQVVTARAGLDHLNLVDYQ